MKRLQLSQIFLFILCFIVSLQTGVHHALALNNQLPEFSLSSNNDNNKEASQTNAQQEAVSITIKRPLTRDILLLQEQINILEGLVSRQSEINKIAKSYEEMNLPFIQPLPPTEICKKLPTNVLCLYSYPEMETQYDDLINAAKIRYEEMQNAKIEESLSKQGKNSHPASYSAPQLNADLLNEFQKMDVEDNLSSQTTNTPQKTAQSNKEDSYFWSDIQCLQTKCTALIVSSDNLKDRFRVSTGDKLSNDAIVTHITPRKVTATLNKQPITIQPLAIDGAKQVKNTKPTTAPIKKQTTGAGVQNSQPREPQQFSGSYDDKATADLLGVTGLF